jgi:bifunctional DNase/RNase
MKYVRMKIENNFINDAHYEAWIHYSENERERKVIAIINGIDENRHFQDLLGRHCESMIKKEFDTIQEAINFLEEKCKSLVIEELTNVAWRGRQAQEKIDCIESMGFQL